MNNRHILHVGVLIFTGVLVGCSSSDDNSIDSDTAGTGDESAGSNFTGDINSLGFIELDSEDAD